ALPTKYACGGTASLRRVGIATSMAMKTPAPDGSREEHFEGILRLMAANGRLDDVDHLLIEELQADARLSLAELGRRVGLTPPAVADRLRKLEDDQTIMGYTARVDPRALGYALTAVVRIRPAPRMIAKVADLARATLE